ncbi:hypothetical protein DB42_EU00130 [Neochlamydia sp. EPS4]|nr:hypothetical protein DB42_EU00130 [Neochlamydia sp. EPS4]
MIDLKKARSFFYFSCFYPKNPLLLAAQLKAKEKNTYFLFKAYQGI